MPLLTIAEPAAWRGLPDTRTGGTTPLTAPVRSRVPPEGCAPQYCLSAQTSSVSRKQSCHGLTLLAWAVGTAQNTASPTRVGGAAP